MAALLLLPVFFLSLACTAYGLWRVRGKVKQGLILFSGIPVLVVTFPVALFMINGMLSGAIENRMSLLLSIAEFLMIDDGDIYMGAGGLILVVVLTVLLVFQILLIRGSLNAEQ